jgi:radical SAM superfamily enzyme YgiQ (UPF0313 family)
MKILLLNPPADTIFVRRANYCSDTAKGRYREPPVDLVILSGVLAQSHDVSFMEGVAPGVTAEDCYQRIADDGIEAVVMLMALVSRATDIPFVRELRRRFPHLLIVAGGDVVRFATGDLLRDCPELDALLLDYTSPSILRFFAGERRGLQNLICREEAGSRPLAAVMERVFDIPVPRHELFIDSRYRSAVSVHRRQAVTIMSFGCPSRCNFCPLETINYRLREMESAKAEMRYIKELGFRDILFSDATFAAAPKWTEEFLEFMATEIQLPWWCHTRADTLNEKLVKLMKRAGCHTITIGVETASDEINANFEKDTDVALTRQAFDLCRKAGIRTLGHFIVGLPGETVETTQRSIEYAIELDPFYASFNIAEAMAGTSFGDEYRERFGEEAKQDRFLSQFFPAQTSGLTFEQAKSLRNEAVRRFYFRPAKMARLLFSARSWYELEKLAVNGIELLRRY